MATELATLARPYAEAAFACAVGADSLERWSEMIRFLADVVLDEHIAQIVEDPRVNRAQVEHLLVEVAGDQLSEEGLNFLGILMSNRRLPLLPEISRLFEARKREHEDALDVHIVSAYAVSAAQQMRLTEMLGARFGKSVILTTEKDPALIGGIKIRAGDLVIDHSLQGGLNRLAAELKI